MAEAATTPTGNQSNPSSRPVPRLGQIVDDFIDFKPGFGGDLARWATVRTDSYLTAATETVRNSLRRLNPFYNRSATPASVAAPAPSIATAATPSSAAQAAPAVPVSSAVRSRSTKEFAIFKSHLRSIGNQSENRAYAQIATLLAERKDTPIGHDLNVAAILARAKLVGARPAVLIDQLVGPSIPARGEEFRFARELKATLPGTQIGSWSSPARRQALQAMQENWSKFQNGEAKRQARSASPSPQPQPAPIAQPQPIQDARETEILRKMSAIGAAGSQNTAEPAEPIARSQYQAEEIAGTGYVHHLGTYYGSGLQGAGDEHRRNIDALTTFFGKTALGIGETHDPDDHVTRYAQRHGEKPTMVLFYTEAERSYAPYIREDIAPAIFRAFERDRRLDHDNLRNALIETATRQVPTVDTAPRAVTPPTRTLDLGASTVARTNQAQQPSPTISSKAFEVVLTRHLAAVGVGKDDSLVEIKLAKAAIQDPTFAGRLPDLDPNGLLKPTIDWLRSQLEQNPSIDLEQIRDASPAALRPKVVKPELEQTDATVIDSASPHSRGFAIVVRNTLKQASSPEGKMQPDKLLAITKAIEREPILGTLLKELDPKGVLTAALDLTRQRSATAADHSAATIG